MQETIHSLSAGMAHQDLKTATILLEQRKSILPKESVKEFMHLYKIAINHLKLFGGSRLVCKEYSKLFPMVQ